MKREGGSIPDWAALSAMSPRVPVTTRWAGSRPTLDKSRRSIGRFPAKYELPGDFGEVFDSHEHHHGVDRPRKLFPADRVVLFPVGGMTCGDTHGGREVAMGEGYPAYAAAPVRADTPGTISKGMPSSASRSASSPPRPKRNGSPPLSRMTSTPVFPVLDEEPGDFILAHRVPAGTFPDIDDGTAGLRLVEEGGSTRRSQRITSALRTRPEPLL